MGVVTNEINIKKLQVGMEALPVIMSSVQSMDLRIGAVEEDITAIKAKTDLTVTASENVTIHESTVVRHNDIVEGYVRFTVSSDMTETADYNIFDITGGSPKQLHRYITFSEWSADYVGNVVINENGHCRSVSTSIRKGTMYSVSFSYVVKD